MQSPDEDGAYLCRFALVQTLPDGGVFAYAGGADGRGSARLVPGPDGWQVEEPGLFLGPLPELGDPPRGGS